MRHHRMDVGAETPSTYLTLPPRRRQTIVEHQGTINVEACCHISNELVGRRRKCTVAVQKLCNEIHEQWRQRSKGA